MKCHSFTVLRSEAYKRHCAGRHEKAGRAKKHSRETYSSEASPQGAFWCFVRLWCVRGVGRGIFLLPGIKKASRGGEPVFSMAEGDQQTPSALLTQKNRPHRGRFFLTVEKPSGFFGLLFVFRVFLGFLLLVFRLLALVNVLHLPNSRYATPGKPGRVEKVQAWQAAPGSKTTRILSQMSPFYKKTVANVR